MKAIGGIMRSASSRVWLGLGFLLALSVLVATPSRGAAIDDLFKAVRENDINILDRMIEEYGPESVHMMTRTGVTPLHLAAALNRTAMAGYLVTRGADVQAQTAGGFTPLHWAAGRNAAATAKLLISLGADPNTPNDKGITPLHWAAGKNATETIRTLLAAGANIHVMTKDDLTPLHWAVMHDANEAAEILAYEAVSDESGQPAVDPELNLKRAARDNTQAVVTASAKTADRPAVPSAEVKPPMPKPATTAKPTSPVIVAPPEGQPGLPAVRVTDVADSDEFKNPPPPDALLRAAEAIPSAGQPASPERSDLPAVVREAEEMAKLPDPPPASKELRSLTVPIGFGHRLEFVWLEEAGVWFGKYEITNGQYRRFNAKHNSMFNQEFSLDGIDQPAVYVSWNDAKAFCQWLNRSFATRIDKGGIFRLPTDQEWMEAARCGENRIYPWGNEWPPKYGNYSDLMARRQLPNWVGIEDYDDGFVVTAPVRESGKNEWGIFGLAGNVWEWCEEWQDSTRQYKIRHGGCWDFDGQQSLRIDTRGTDRPDAAYDTIGFRVVMEPSRN